MKAGTKVLRKLMGLILSVHMLGLGACASLQDKPEDPAEDILKEAIFQKKKEEPYQRLEGSLWPGETSDNLLFADTKAKQMGDVVTIDLEEDFSSSNSATTATSRDSDINLETNTILGLPTSFGMSNFLGSTQAFDPSVNASVSRSHDGEGTTTRSGSVSGTMAAIITEVLPNGIFRIEGRRTVTINEEDQIMILRGLIRRVDIGFNNTISSQNVANASITYMGKGVVSEEQRVGWLTRILAYVWPF
jgi:flagellar L-ring protein precursor FlgH